MLKNRNCGELTAKDIGSKVDLAGWVDRRRDHGGLIFIDLRDRSGIAQIVFNPEIAADCHKIASDLRIEFVVKVTGEVAARPKGTENPKLPTGEVEIIAREVTILNTAKTPPFYINEEAEVDENVRLRYRYLDLRRPRMRDNLIMTHKVYKYIRDYLDNKGFLDVETPMLLKSTPEGARDYLVPARLYPGKFYALPQSPQQLKQLLMVAGIEKYYQLARCFRDEDTRADRQPEFTQLDIEMSFVEEEDIMCLMEELFIGMMEKLKPERKLTKPFPRITYADAMEYYGVDKPDLRFGLKIADISDIAASTEFSIFKSAIGRGDKVKAIAAPGCAGYTRHQLDELISRTKEMGAQGLITVALGTAPGGSLDTLTMEQVRSMAAKFITIDHVKKMAERLGANMGDLILIVAAKPAVAAKVLGQLRIDFGKALKLFDPEELKFEWVINFPLFEWQEEMKRYGPMHHPFTSAQAKDVDLLETHPELVHGRHYDIVLNGYEIGGGSIRIHQPEMQQKVFKILGHSEERAKHLFGHLLEAFEYGAPPHGGIAIGMARLLMILQHEETIREVIPFPKNQNAYDLMFNSPDTVSDEQLKELHIRLTDV